MKMTEEIARAAAHWWAQQATGLKHHSNGSNDDASFMAGLLADTMTRPALPDELKKFEDILAEKLQHAPGYYSRMSFGVDYGPDKIFCEAAREAGIEAENFPWKTFMLIQPDEGKIVVREGYRAPWNTIWEEKKDAAMA